MFGVPMEELFDFVDAMDNEKLRQMAILNREQERIRAALEWVGSINF